jgi:hypothetical protein
MSRARALIVQEHQKQQRRQQQQRQQLIDNITDENSIKKIASWFSEYMDTTYTEPKLKVSYEVPN